jgi:hypothetical protein
METLREMVEPFHYHDAWTLTTTYDHDARELASHAIGLV